MKLISKSLHTRLIRHLREWHRKLGIIAAFFIIFLSISGVALNHTTTLSLAHQPIANTWLLDHYGIASPTDVRIYQHNTGIDTKTLQVTNNYLWLNDQLLLESIDTIIAATFIASTQSPESKVVLAVSSNQIYLINLQGDLIDQIDETLGLPQNIEALSVEYQNILVKTPSGYYQSTADFFEWQQVNFITEPDWIKPIEISEQAITKVELLYRSQFLTLERIILDAHSGRLFGLIGVLFMDAVAILLILLSISGVYMWIRHARAKR